METIIVIGAGAAGLISAYELSKNNKVIVLEATSRLGGRIHTYKDDSFSFAIELGAEFIHGKLPLTLELLKKADIKYHAIKGKMFHFENGKISRAEDDENDWNELIESMKELKYDMALSAFLQKFFSDDKYENLRASVKRFAEGFDLADISKVSTISLYNEWSNDDHVQYRLDEGYQKLISFLESECKKNGCVIYTDCCVKKINWQKNKVNIITMCSRYFQSEKVVITVPISVLQADKSDLSYIEFEPSIDNYLNAAKDIGFGNVIKILLEFDEAFWQEENKNIGFIFTNKKIPTWWTQLPKYNNILTGWFGGRKTSEIENVSEEELLTMSLESLSFAFSKTVDVLRKKLKAFKIVNWKNVPQIAGGYSYDMINSNASRNLLNQPIQQTIFFAGEALYDGVTKGTVEAALQTGKQAALKIMNNSAA